MSCVFVLSGSVGTKPIPGVGGAGWGESGLKSDFHLSRSYQQLQVRFGGVCKCMLRRYSELICIPGICTCLVWTERSAPDSFWVPSSFPRVLEESLLPFLSECHIPELCRHLFHQASSVWQKCIVVCDKPMIMLCIFIQKEQSPSYSRIASMGYEQKVLHEATASRHGTFNP